MRKNHRTTLFLDTEFTGLRQNTELISLALVGPEEQWFYAEFTDYDAGQLSDWHRTNVLPYLWLEKQSNISLPGDGVCLRADRVAVSDALKDWLSRWGDVQIWADVPAYDWVLFCELFSGSLHLPDGVPYMVMDLATLFHVRGMDTNISRQEFVFGDAGPPPEWPQHNALVDAWVGLECLKKLLNA